jgi:uncharacterized protein (DUF1778 family)
MSVAGRREQHLSVRLLEADIAIIDRAARLRGRSRTDRMRDAAVAQEVLMERALIPGSTSRGDGRAAPAPCAREIEAEG